jgi:hypothetical protein
VVAFCSVATTSFWCETSFRDFGRYRSTQGVDSVAELIVNEIECDNRLGGASTILIYCIRMQALVRVRRRCQNGYSMIIAEALGFGLPKNLLPAQQRITTNKKCAKRLRWRAFRAIYFSDTNVISNQS